MSKMILKKLFLSSHKLSICSSMDSAGGTGSAGRIGSVFIGCCGAGLGLGLCILVSTPDHSIIIDSDNGCANKRGEMVLDIGAYERGWDSDCSVMVESRRLVLEHGE
jgi:hypothetical protein